MVKKLRGTLGSLVDNWRPSLLSRPTHCSPSLPPPGLALALAAAALAAGVALYLRPGPPRQPAALAPSPPALLAELATREELSRAGYLVNRGGAPPTAAAPQISSRGGARPTAIPQPTPTPIPKVPFAYQVAEGDTVAGLAERFSVSPETIVWANGLAGAGATLQPGRVLTILPRSGVLHTVRQRETLNGIAKAYGVEAATIVEVNALEDADTLGIGQEIVIPGGRPLPSPTPPPTTAPRPSPTGAPPAATSEAATPSPEGTDKGAEIAAIAARYEGYPYVYGGSSPSGFDCSGFAQYVYAQAGVSIPRSSAEQAGAGVAVSRDALLPGDLIIFAGTYSAGISHVGIYVGGGRMIHASTPSRGVCYDSLDEAYWVAHYYSARRPW